MTNCQTHYTIQMYLNLHFQDSLNFTHAQQGVAIIFYATHRLVFFLQHAMLDTCQNYLECLS